MRDSSGHSGFIVNTFTDLNHFLYILFNIFSYA